MALGQHCRHGVSNVGLGLVHGMAHPLGAFYNTRTAWRMRFCYPRDALQRRLQRRSSAISLAQWGERGWRESGQARQSAVDAVFRLNRDVGIPQICVTLGYVKRIFRRWHRRLC
ncbi:hypothetical protein DMH17_14315 [Raoultella planticola]|nr:hypothetical protein [Raoultella planticola]